MTYGLKLLITLGLMKHLKKFSWGNSVIHFPDCKWQREKKGFMGLTPCCLSKRPSLDPGWCRCILRGTHLRCRCFWYKFNNYCMLTDWLNEEGLEHACTFCLHVHACNSLPLQLVKEREREREGVRERERRRERKREVKREWERERERKKERDVEYGIFIFKRKDGCLVTF